MNLYAIIIPFLSGLAFYIGYLITKLIKNKHNLVIFAIGFAFTILLGLIVFDLIPECIEIFDKAYSVAIYAIVGILLLKSLDILLPNHEHTEKTNHIEHIGLISCIALLLHNVIEATAIYTTSLTNIKMGILMAIGVSFHNIPLGIQVSSLSRNNKRNLLFTSLLAFSSVFGALLLELFSISISETVLGVLISITLGMLIYIVFFELLCEVKENIKTKPMFYGLLLGLLLTIIMATL